MIRIFTDYYRGEKLTASKSRYDITASTEGYDLFEKLLINKRAFNIGGLSFNCVKRPGEWKGGNLDLAITKGNNNITSIFQPDIKSNYGYGNINGTNDACIVVFPNGKRSDGIKTIEVFIARGYKNMERNLYEQFAEGEFNEELDYLRRSAGTKFVTDT